VKLHEKSSEPGKEIAENVQSLELNGDVLLLGDGGTQAADHGLADGSRQHLGGQRQFVDDGLKADGGDVAKLFPVADLGILNVFGIVYE
jgi:hypothetical protein